jgi:methylmalonyl-CoA/ethylmalonyl-CoA epimerase
MLLAPISRLFVREPTPTLPEQAMTDVIQIHHVSIAVPDLDVAIEWYGRVLGFSDPKHFRIDALDARMAFIRRGALRLELWQHAEAQPVPAERRQPDTDLRTCGTKHMGLAVHDLKTHLERFVYEGVDIAGIQRSPAEPMRSDPNPLTSDSRPPFAMFIRDPGGTLIEILDADALDRVLPN